MNSGQATYRIAVGGVTDPAINPVPGWTFRWIDRAAGVGQLRGEGRQVRVVVEGSAQDWFVTLRGRRIPVTVRSWREQVLAEATLEAATRRGPLDVTATLPGLVVAVETAEGSEVAVGDPLLTIEAMKMQNEIRAPRAGRVVTIAVEAGQAVGRGQLLLRLE